MTITVFAEEKLRARIIAQMNKLINVVEAIDLTDSPPRFARWLYCDSNPPTCAERFSKPRRRSRPAWSDPRGPAL